MTIFILAQLLSIIVVNAAMAAGAVLILMPAARSLIKFHAKVNKKG